MDKLKFLGKYAADRSGVTGLLLVTCGLFVAVGSLNHIENVSKLGYAFLLAAFFWLCYGIKDFRRCCIRYRRLQTAGRNLEQAEELLAQETHQRYTVIEQAYEELLGQLLEQRRIQQSENEQKRGEMNDYYLMWAHQIKTPIAAMKLLLEEREDSFLLSGELFKVEQYVEMVLHYLRLESISSDMILKEYPLADMVRQTVKKFSILFINKELSLRLGDMEGVMVLTDEKWFCFVLEQILSNSIKYTRKGTISIYMEPEEKKTLVVEDTGIGIRAEDLPRIFERGFTGYNGRMDKKSTGIGLYLSKQVWNQLAHGMEVTSEEGKGTKVRLKLDRETA